MNQLNNLIIFVFLSSGLLGSVQCFRNKPISYFSRAFNYSFEGFSCVQLVSKKDVSWEYYKLPHMLGIPVVTNQSQKYCNGFVLFAEDTTHLREMLQSIKKYYYHRIVCYFKYENLKIDEFVKNESYLFGESEALVINGYNTYKMDQLEKRFLEINLYGEQETWGKHKPIMNFKGHTFTATGFNISMFTEFGPIDEKGHPAWIKGTDLHVLWMLAPLINVTFKVVISTDKWGVKMENGTWTPGLFKTVLEGGADIAMGSIWMTIDKYESVSLSTPTALQTLQFLIRRPAATNTIGVSFFQHYPLSIWALLLFAVFINIFAVFLVTYCTKIIRNDINYENWSAISTCSLMTFGMISVDASLPSFKNPGPARFLLCGWAITTFILMSNFGSSLISHLTTPELHHRPESIKGLVTEGYFWGLTYIPDFERILDLSNPWHKKWAKRFILIKDKEQHLKFLTNDKFVLWGKAFEKKYFVMMEDYWRSDLLSGFELSNEVLTTFYTTFALTPGSRLLPAINKYTRRVIESGHLGNHLSGAFMKEGDAYMTEVVVKTKQGAIGCATLTLSNFQGVFCILFVGLSIAIILFFSEIVYYKNTTH